MLLRKPKNLIRMIIINPKKVKKGGQLYDLDSKFRLYNHILTYSDYLETYILDVLQFCKANDLQKVVYS